MNKIRIAAALIGMLFFVSACGPSEAELAETEQVISSTEQAQSTNTMSARQTSESATQEFKTQVANTAQAGTSQASTATEAFQATETSALATEQQRTQNAVIRQTEAASGIYQVVQALYEAGYISRTEGSFQQLPDFDESWAQIGWFFVSPIEDSFVTDFVLVVDVSWESASRAADFYRSGCGVAFRVAHDVSEYYTFMLGLDGNMNFFPKLSNSNTVYLSKSYWGKIDHMEDSTTFIITAEGINYQVFNEELERIDMRNGAELLSGFLAYQLASGINTDFGTRCNFSDTELWRLEN